MERERKHKRSSSSNLNHSIAYHQSSLTLSPATNIRPHKMASLTSRSNTSHGSYDNSIAAAAAITTNNTANPILNTAGTTSRRLRSEAPWWWGSSRSHGTPLRVVASTMSMVKITMATGILLVSSVMVYQFAWTHWLPGWLAPADTELDWDRGRTVTRRRPDKMVKTLRSGETVPR